jgi:uncharacterized protein (TIGR03437 family)
MRFWTPVILFSLTISSIPAADFSFAGNFQRDDEHRNFSVTTSKPSTLTVRTLSYAGGANASGIAVPAGGFDPTLSVFDSSGNLIAVNRDGGCDSVARDPVTAFCWDSSLSVAVPAGAYQIVLTQADNTPQGPTIKDPFVYDGAGNFTADPQSPESTGFWDLSLHHRGNEFALNIQGVDSAQLGFTPQVNAMVNAASSQAAQIAPNTILSYYALGLGGDGISVSIGGTPATILYSGASQINFVVPPSVTATNGAALVQISRGGLLLVSTPVTAVAASPALFTANGQGFGQGSILNQNFSANSAANPAKQGSYVMVYGTGFGATLPPGPDGLSMLASGVSATVGGAAAEVTYAGLAPGQTPGLQQINVHLPADCPVGDAVGIQLTINGVATQTGVTLAVTK